MLSVCTTKIWVEYFVQYTGSLFTALKLNQQKQFEYDLMHERTDSFAVLSEKLQHLKRNAYSANISNDKMDHFWYFTTSHSISFTPCRSGTDRNISSHDSVPKT